MPIPIARKCARRERVYRSKLQRSAMKMCVKPASDAESRDMDINGLLSQLLPAAVFWANEQNEMVQRIGRPLAKPDQDLARKVGVKHPDQIRVMYVEHIPIPDDPLLKEAALSTGALNEGTSGLTLGYSILLRTGRADARLLSHECRHVHQYENFGSIEGFLTEYLRQVLTNGYTNAPLEIDARDHEVHEI
ncbi:MAG: hypothetical protein V4757_18750 [Pseudomonadota bacterium]